MRKKAATERVGDSQLKKGNFGLGKKKKKGKI